MCTPFIKFVMAKKLKNGFAVPFKMGFMRAAVMIDNCVCCCFYF